MNRRLLLVPLLLLAACRSGPAPPATIALVADVQHADKPDAGTRHYRQALEHLRACAADLAQRESLSCVVQLGDLIDGRKGDPAGTREDLEQVLALFEGIGVPVEHVLGNHCLEVARAELEPRLGLGRSAWHSFSLPGWRVILLDTLHVSVIGVPVEDPRRVEAEAWLATHPQAQFKNATRWNGAVGEEQRGWLAAQLALASSDGERALVMGHLPVLAAASTEHHIAWDHDQVRALLEASSATFAYISGHDHAGGYATSGGVHYLTLHGMVEAPADSNAYAVVRLLSDRLEFDGYGEEPDRVLLPLR